MFFVLRPNHSKDDWPEGPLPRSTLCVCAVPAKANPHGWARRRSKVIVAGNIPLFTLLLHISLYYEWKFYILMVCTWNAKCKKSTILMWSNDWSFSETEGAPQHGQYWQIEWGWGDWGMFICCRNYWESSCPPQGLLQEGNGDGERGLRSRRSLAEDDERVDSACSGAFSNQRI